jgi:UDP-N-acetylmuramyl pentapeptide phosphotransferase/UDP-N-acetylglucosamine-1-phosphate transferase
MSDGDFGILHGAVTVTVAVAASAALIVALYPWLERYALARPNARSSHRTPTPQGGGIAVIAATLIAVGACAGLFAPHIALDAGLVPVVVATLVMAGLGAVDDIRPLAVAPRLLLQALAAAAVLYAVPADLRIVPSLPWWIERSLLLIGGLWFVNLVNFMDGIDWMTVAEVVPLTAALAVIGTTGALPPYGIAVALALCGAMIGFAYFNKPVARVFLGDVGSLPIGLLLAWLLLLIAGSGHIVAALVLPLYYLADATITLGRRFAGGEPVWQAHRTHFYQRATDRGFTVTAIVIRVFVVNVALGALAVFSVTTPGAYSAATALAGGVIVVGWLLFAFARGRK